MHLSIRDEIVFAAGYETLGEGLRDLGIRAVELWVKRDDTVPAIAPERDPEHRTRLDITSPADLDELHGQARAEGVHIAALCMGNNFNAENKPAEYAWAVRAVRAAHELGAPALRIDAIMSGEKDLPLERRQELVATAIQTILHETSTTGVDLGIENHGFQGNDPDFLAGLLARVGSHRLGLTLDSGNFYWRGWPLSKVYEIFAQFAPVVKHTHIKNIHYPVEIRETERAMGYEYGKYVCPIHEGDIDHTRYITLLQHAGYDRDICLEDESLSKYTPDQRKANLRATADFFRPLF